MSLAAALMAMLLLLTGCATQAPAADASAEAPTETGTQYITKEDLKAALDAGDAGYILLDVRKAADYAAAHIPGAISVDMDAAVQGDIEAGTAAMKAAIEGVDDTLVLVCYSGKKYAQASTNILSSLGYDTSKVFTLQDGFNNWSEAKADLIETGE